MRIILSLALSSALSVFLFFTPAMAEEQPQARKDTASQKEQKEKLSYSLGYGIGSQMRKSSVDLEPGTFIKAFRKGLAGEKAAMTEQEMRDAVQFLQKEMQVKQLKEAAEKNKQEGETFLAENAKKEGVVTLPSGLQYKIIKEGGGKSPKATDTVTINYRGTLADGPEFANSYNKRNKPATFRLGKGIAGWNEALPLMKEGAQWQLFVPPYLAYGEKGVVTGKKKKTMIPPNATVIYDVELISVTEAPAKVAENPETPEQPLKANLPPQAEGVDNQPPVATQIK